MKSTHWWVVVAASLLGVAIVAVLGALAVDRACLHGPPPASVPDSFTPRGRYCTRVESLHLWWFLIAVPVVATCLALFVAWRRPRVALAVVTVVCLCVVANAIVANHLTRLIEI